MNFDKIFFVNNLLVSLISDNVVLKLNEVTKSIFVVKNDVNFAVDDVVIYGISSPKKKQRILTGRIKTVVRIDDIHSRLFVEEIAGDLINGRFAFSCSNCSAKDVLDKLSILSGVNVNSQGAWKDKLIGNFVGNATGQEILRQVAGCWQVDDFCWLSSEDASIWFGGYSDCQFAQKKVVLPQNIFSQMTVCGGECMLIAGAVPGSNVQIGDDFRRVKEVVISGNKMRLKW